MEKVFEEFRGDVLINRIVQGQLERDAHKVERIHRHPRGAVGLVNETSGRQRGAAIEYADVVQAKKAALENVTALRVLAIHPPGEIEHELVEDSFKKGEIARV